MAENKPKISKKKASNSFKRNIKKSLSFLGESQISSPANSQLDELLKVVCRKISSESRDICLNFKKLTQGAKEITLAIKNCLPEEIVEESNKKIQDSINSYESFHKKSDEALSSFRRETQANLVFSVSLAEKYIRNFGYSKTSVSKLAPIILAALLESICDRILYLCVEIAKKNNKVIITQRHLYLAVMGDAPLSQMVSSMNIEFMGCGVVPNIDPRLTPSKQKKTQQAARRRKNDKNKNAGEKKAHKFLPCTKAMMNIRAYQKECKLLSPSLPFERTVRFITDSIVGSEKSETSGIRFSSGTIKIIQYFVEQKTITLLQKALQITLHSGREGITGEDIYLAWELCFPSVKQNETDEVEVGDNAISRIALMAGSKRKSSTIYSVTRKFIYSLIKEVLSRSLRFVSHKKAMTVYASDLKITFESMGTNFIIPLTIKSKKQKTKKNGLRKEEKDIEDKEIEVEDEEKEIEVEDEEENLDEEESEGEEKEMDEEESEDEDISMSTN